MFLNALKTVWKADALEVAAIIKRVFLDFLQPASLFEGNLSQALAFEERVFLDLPDTLRNGYLFQSAALKA